MITVATLEPNDITVQSDEQVRSCFRPILLDRRSRRRRSFRNGLAGSCPRRPAEHLRQGAWELAA